MTNHFEVKKAEVAVSVVIPCRNEVTHIESCVRSILAQNTKGMDFEVLVVDGMSDDGTRSVLARLADSDPRLRIIENVHQIVSTGLNLGIRAARGRVIIRIDVHTEYAPDYLRQCISVLEETGADNVGGPWVACGRGYVGRAIAATFQSAFAVGGSRAHAPEYEGPVDTVYLGCWPREVFNKIGIFDEELVRNQDDEFNLRLTRTGGKIWQSPKIKSRYATRDSLRDLFRQYLQYGYWKVRVIQKHKMPASIMYLVPGVFVFTLLALVIASIIVPAARYALAFTMGSYLCAVSAASVLTAYRRGWAFLPLFPIIFACFHFSFGIGFLHGMLDFILLRRGARRQFALLTRESARPAD
jgi:glycosyltransferase involved in cell wall biosynthesis